MSTAPIPASKLLNAFIKDEIGPVLVAAGFKATGRVFRRAAGEALQVVDVQNWKFNDAKRARFTLEVGVCFPRLLAAVAALSDYAFYLPNVGKPGITECAVRRRLGMFLDPPQDTWWTVSATTGYLPPAQEVTGPLTGAALPWMDALSTVAALAAARDDAHVLAAPVMSVAALFAAGQSAAADAAAAALARARHPTQPELESRLLDDLRTLSRLEQPGTGAG